VFSVIKSSAGEQPDMSQWRFSTFSGITLTIQYDFAARNADVCGSTVGCARDPVADDSAGIYQGTVESK